MSAARRGPEAGGGTPLGSPPRWSAAARRSRCCCPTSPSTTPGRGWSGVGSWRGSSSSTAAGPSWKPLPVLVDAPLSLLGDGAPRSGSSSPAPAGCWRRCSPAGWRRGLPDRRRGAGAGRRRRSPRPRWPERRRLHSARCASSPVASRSRCWSRSCSARSRWRSPGARAAPSGSASPPRCCAPSAWPFLALWAGAGAARATRPAGPGDRRGAVDPARLVRPRPGRAGNALEGSETARRGGLELRRGVRSSGGPWPRRSPRSGSASPAVRRVPARAARDRRDPAGRGLRLGGGRGRDGGGRLRRPAALPRPGDRGLRRPRRGGARPGRGAVLRRGVRTRPRRRGRGRPRRRGRRHRPAGRRRFPTTSGPCASRRLHGAPLRRSPTGSGAERLLSCGGRVRDHRSARRRPRSPGSWRPRSRAVRVRRRPRPGSCSAAERLVRGVADRPCRHVAGDAAALLRPAALGVLDQRPRHRRGLGRAPVGLLAGRVRCSW